jgi:ubiquinone/menaquinone biosynthesis C-methylase UbiE
MNKTLENKIDTISNVMNISKITELHPDNNYIARYYSLNKIPYTIFHTRTDFVYMGISKDGIYKEDDLLEAARIVAEYIESTRAENVLELATGRGANSEYLSKLYPKVNFYGIDLSSSHLGFAIKRAGSVKNYHPEPGDYHNLTIYKDNSMNIVFVIEALCHSTHKERVLSEVHRVLKDDGLFIIIDGYRAIDPRSQKEEVAMKLIEKSMALEIFEQYESFKSKTLESGFAIIKDENLSQYILPTLKRFENLARKYFSHKFLAKILYMILPNEVINNAAAGYLMPEAVQMGLFTYQLTVLKKI